MDRQVDGMVTSPARQTLADRFLASCGWQDSSRVRIAGDASNRAYDRLTRAEGGTAILMDAPPETGEDTRPFVHVAAHLRRIGLSAPEVLAADESTGFLLLEDLGDGLFARLMQQDPTTETPLYRAAVDVLIALHAADILPLPPCDADWLIDMTDPFFEWYLHREDATDRAAFHAAFRPCAELVAAAPRVTILRDYHAQNLLWLPDRHGVARVGLLDFQDALSGHRAYDLVSVLQDARRDVSPETKTEMLEYYLSRTHVDEAEFRRDYAALGLQRNLRILGIFARLAKRDGKPSYVDLVPRVWEYVKRNLAHPDLAPVARALAALPDPTPDFLEQLKAR
ncbi:Phosphotransferase enzyme family protein [Sulfitobacter sp. THAF37]|uniref:aminoglycoside phosphotransferase family protein n=1 Tax=Sulfitobacter sp. THAF37 TaxID=2587855 RepID=UPI0012A8BE13|nr:phosphotransferase [Sulfitobacter sp. THAF37]QFT58284.1 Phosphotransferase enzyme family protein [Sulfitobacter sp. THAF37]